MPERTAARSAPPSRDSGPAVVISLKRLQNAADAIRAKRKPGRPRKILKAPTAKERDYAAELRRRKAQHIDASPMVRAVGDRAESGRGR